MSIKEILEFLHSREALIYEASDYIWAHPETAFCEYQSSAKLQSILKAEGFDVRSGAANIPTAFTASFGSGHPVIGILGEFDALPGMSQKADCFQEEAEAAGMPGHGCGHNLLGAGSLAAALAVKDYLLRSGAGGTVVYLGCPGEEGGGGKVYMVREGVFDPIDCVLTWHPSYMNIVVGSSSLATVHKTYRFYGKSSHAAKTPYEGRSALDALELMNVGANFLREHIIPDARVHYAITNAGGSAPNVVQAYAEAAYQVRSPEISDVMDIADWIDDIARGAANMTRTRVEIVFENAYSNTLTNDTLIRLMKETLAMAEPPKYTEQELEYAARIMNTVPNASSLLGRELGKLSKFGLDHLKETPHYGTLPLMPLATSANRIRYGSTDVGDVSRVCPTVQLGCASWAAGTPSHSWQVTAQGTCGYAHKSLLLAGQVLAAAAIRLIEEPTLVLAAQKELSEKLGGAAYVCPIPKEIKPHAPSGVSEG